MSRLEKKMYAERLEDGLIDQGVKMYAFTNKLKGYQVVHSPKQHILVLKCGVQSAAQASQMPCEQWRPFAETVHQLAPESQSVYVVDTSALGERPHEGELLAGTQLGGILRPAEKMILRLNPTETRLVAAGKTYIYALRLLLLGRLGVEGQVSDLVLLCPPCPAKEGSPVSKLLSTVTKHSTSLEPMVQSLTVLVAEQADVDAWTALAPELSQCFKEVTIHRLGKTPMFQRLAEVALGKNGGIGGSKQAHWDPATMDGSRGELRLFKMFFSLSRYSKQIEQTFELVLPPGEEGDEEEDDFVEEQLTPAQLAKEEAAAISTGGAAKLRAFPAEYSTIGFGLEDAKVSLDGIVLSNSMVANAHGIFTVNNIGGLTSAKLPAVKQGVQLTATLGRGEFGNLELNNVEGIHRVAINTADDDENKPKGSLIVPLKDVPGFNHNNIARAYGCVLVRGSKVVVVRSLDGDFEGMRMPWAFHTDSTQSGLECAVNAVCDQCDITPDNFYVHPMMPSVVCYPAVTGGDDDDDEDEDGVKTFKVECPFPVILTLYIAVAVSSPPGGVMTDKVEDEEDDQDTYDWMSYRQACAKVSTAEQSALEDVTRAITKASVNGMYTPKEGLGLFGDSLRKSGEMVGHCFFMISPTMSTDAFKAGAGNPEAAFVNLMSSDHSTKGRIQTLDCATFCPSRHHEKVLATMGTQLEAALQKLDAEEVSPCITCPDSSVNFVVILSPDADLEMISLELIPDMERSLSLRSVMVTALPVGPTTKHFLQPCNPSVMSILDPTFDDELVLQPHCIAAIEAADAVVLLGDDSKEDSGDYIRLLAAVHVVNPEAVIQDTFVSLEDQLSLLAACQNQFNGNGLMGKPEPVLPSSKQVTPFTYTQIRAPAKPEALAGFLQRGVKALRDAQIICCSGDVWVSTRSERRGMLQLQGDSIQLQGGEPWDCTLPATQRAPTADPKKWHPIHGDRVSQLHFIALSPVVGEDCVPIQTFLENVLNPIFASPNEHPAWEKLTDNLPEWAEHNHEHDDEGEEEEEDEDEDQWEDASEEHDDTDEEM